MGLKSMLGGSKTESAKKRPPLRNESLREDPADEHKRVARRRLIGAVALLLLAIIILPLVLEDAPKPVSSDIALQIPSRDLAVRSNPDATPPAVRDEGAASKTDAKPDSPSDPKVGVKPDAKVDVKADNKAENKAENKVENKPDNKAEPKADAKPETKAVARPDVKSEAKGDTKSDTKAEQKSEARPEIKPAVKPTEVKTAEPKAGKHLNVVQGDDPIAGFANAKPAVSPAAPAPASTASTGAAGTSGSTSSTSAPGRSNHWVQIGAFGNEGKAREMASQLRGKGYPAVTEVVRSGNGTQSELYRVRVGPLETRESASRARDNLAKSGFEGAVVQ